MKNSRIYLDPVQKGIAIVRPFSNRVYLASPRGFCAGVERAVRIVEEALAEYGAPVYVRHDIVHNEHVVQSFREQGVVFVEELSEVAPDRPVIFSAHGVSPEVEREAAELGLSTVDATCPLVKKIHRKAKELKESGYTVILIGHRKHPEIIGTLGHLGGEGTVVENTLDAAEVKFPESINKITYLTQTTLSPDDVSSTVSVLRNRFPALEEPKKDDICYATLERQKAVRRLAEICPVILIIGSPESSNSNRLKEVAEQAGAEAYLIRTYRDIPDRVLQMDTSLGVTAGASAPEILISELLEHFRESQIIEY